MEQLKSVCSNPWCKATFVYSEKDMIKTENVSIPPKQCNKCISFDTELSGGVDWTDQNYEGSRIDNTPHQIKYRVTNFKL